MFVMNLSDGSFGPGNDYTPRILGKALWLYVHLVFKMHLNGFQNVKKKIVRA